MAYENCGVIVILSSEYSVILRSGFPNTASVPELARIVQYRQFSKTSLRVFLPTEEHIVTPFLARCVRHPESFLLNG
jgi:hypothetical protein